jgi:hypothetical protein
MNVDYRSNTNIPSRFCDKILMRLTLFLQKVSSLVYD